MSAKTVIALCFQAFLVQCALSQALSVGRNYNTGLGVEVDATSRGAAGLSGYNLGTSRIGLNNVGLNGVGLNNVGLSGVGLNNVGVTGVGNAGASLVNGLTGYGRGVPDVAAVSSVPVTGPFGATGNAELAVGGEFAAAGSTVVAGQIPVIGAVSFTGSIPASGVVSIAGNCGCSSLPL